MRVWLVLEGAGDRAIVRALLPPALLECLSIVETGSRADLASVVRTLLVKHREPVAVLANTYSVDTGVTHERYTTLEYLVHAVAGGVPYRLILAIPELEVIFFEVPDVLTRIFPDADLSSHLVFYKGQPKQALALLFKQGGGPKDLPALLDAFTDADVERLRQVTPIAELIAFAEEMTLAGGRRHAK